VGSTHHETPYYVENLTLDTIKAENNWWGQRAAPHPSKFYVPVDRDLMGSLTGVRTGLFTVKDNVIGPNVLAKVNFHYDGRVRE
jgi:hypothetical protein